MFLPHDKLNTTDFFSKTIACTLLDVNDGNDKNPRSHVRSHGNALINNSKNVQCERVNKFSRAYVRIYFPSRCFISTFISPFISVFFLRVRVYFIIHSFTFNKIKYKNNSLPCERLLNFIPTLFTRSHGV
ncbi:hypothetical protein AS4_17230 [Acinetobacter guillouiae]|nr:hypothetical protein AS4_17230 [Acinetobacter guillouiae]